MWDMCPEKMKIFTQEMCKDGRDASEKSGIVDIIHGMKMDDFLFEPCGYSMNGLLPDVSVVQWSPHFKTFNKI